MQTLSDKLRIVADKLDAGTLSFEWVNQGHCCCGVVAQMLLNKTGAEINEDFWGIVDNIKNKPVSKSWESIVNEVCPITGQSVVGIFADLNKAGLSRDDIIYLESLSDPKVLALCESKTVIRTVGLFFKKKIVEKVKFDKFNKKDLSNYLRGLAKIKESVSIEEQEEPVVKPTNRIAEMQNN